MSQTMELKPASIGNLSLRREVRVNQAVTGHAERSQKAARLDEKFAELLRDVQTSLRRDTTHQASAS